MWSSSVQTGTEISIAGITAKELAKEFGTPTFFIDQADFYARATEWNTALKNSFGDDAGTVYYAGLKILESVLMFAPAVN
jgi:diaminopimelate decarboxylase